MEDEQIINENTSENVELKVQKSNNEHLVKWLVGIGFVISIIILIVIKSQNPEFPLKYIIIIFSFILVAAIILFFGFDIYRKYQQKITTVEKESKLPEVATEEQLKRRVESILSSDEFQNHVKRFLNIKQQFINKNLVYDFEIKPLYNDKTNDDIIHIIINAHYIERLPTILFNPSSGELYKSINAASTNPFQSADIEKTEIFNPLTNTVIKTAKKTHTKDNIKKNNITKEELA